MKYCSECGNRLSEEVKHCPECGYKLSDTNIAIEKNESNKQNVKSKRAVDNKLMMHGEDGRKKKISLVFPFFVFIVGFLLLLSIMSLNLYAPRIADYSCIIPQEESSFDYVSPSNSYIDIYDKPPLCLNKFDIHIIAKNREDLTPLEIEIKIFDHGDGPTYIWKNTSEYQGTIELESSNGISRIYLGNNDLNYDADVFCQYEWQRDTFSMTVLILLTFSLIIGGIIIFVLQFVRRKNVDFDR